MGYWSELEDKKARCACHHKKGNHHYIRIVGDNTGRCLTRGCDCEIYKENR